MSRKVLVLVCCFNLLLAIGVIVFLVWPHPTPKVSLAAPEEFKGHPHKFLKMLDRWPNGEQKGT